MMTRYAANTSVSADKSRAEIEKTLQRFGAQSFAYGWDNSRSMIEFGANGRRIRFAIPMPDPNEQRFTHTSAKRTKRSAEAALAAWEQATRQSWRALALVVKAKLEAVDSGITTFEDEFLAHVVLPNGETAGQWINPQIDKAYESGTMPGYLPELSAAPSIDVDI